MPEAVKPLPSFSGKSAAPRKSLAAPGLDHPEPGLRHGLLLRPWQKVRSDICSGVSLYYTRSWIRASHQLLHHGLLDWICESDAGDHTSPPLLQVDVTLLYQQTASLYRLSRLSRPFPAFSPILRSSSTDFSWMILGTPG
jgi:hypothetical protein